MKRYWYQVIVEGGFYTGMTDAYTQEEAQEEAIFATRIIKKDSSPIKSITVREAWAD